MTDILHLSQSVLVWDIGKQRRPRSDAALFAYRNFDKKYNKNEQSTPYTPKFRNGLAIDKDGDVH